MHQFVNLKFFKNFFFKVYQLTGVCVCVWKRECPPRRKGCQMAGGGAAPAAPLIVRPLAQTRGGCPTTAPLIDMWQYSLWKAAMELRATGDRCATRPAEAEGPAEHGEPACAAGWPL